jgi:hypothetical protein
LARDLFWAKGVEEPGLYNFQPIVMVEEIAVKLP